MRRLIWTIVIVVVLAETAHLIHAGVTHDGFAGRTDFQDRNGGLGTGFTAGESTQANGFGYVAPVDPHLSVSYEGSAWDRTVFDNAFPQTMIWEVHLQAAMYGTAMVDSKSNAGKLALAQVALDAWGHVDAVQANSCIVAHPNALLGYLQQTYVRGNGVPHSYIVLPPARAHAIMPPYNPVTQEKTVTLNFTATFTGARLKFEYRSYGNLQGRCGSLEERVESAFRGVQSEPTRPEIDWTGSYVRVEDPRRPGFIVNEWKLK